MIDEEFEAYVSAPRFIYIFSIYYKIFEFHLFLYQLHFIKLKFFVIAQRIFPLICHSLFCSVIQSIFMKF